MKSSQALFLIDHLREFECMTPYFLASYPADSFVI